MHWNFLTLDPELSGRLCLTLMHSLWQISVLVFVVWCIDQIWRSGSVEHRYTVNVAALVVALLALPITYQLIDIAEPEIDANTEPSAIAPLLQTKPVSPENASLINERLASTTKITTPVEGLQEKQNPQLQTTVTANAPIVDQPPARQSSMWLLLTPWIVALYAAGVALMFARLIVSSIRANRLRSHAVIITDGPLVDVLRSLSKQWSMKVVPILARAEQVIVPKVVGIARPTILLPASAITGLSTEELELILAHELAHVRRYDMWVNLLQRFAETILFFNPALWYLNRRISILREYCCDEMACRVSSNTLPEFETRVRYATTLLRIAELAKRTTTKNIDLSSLAASGRSPSEIRRRVARLFGEPIHEPLRISRSGVFALLVIAFAMMLAPLVSTSTAQTAPKIVATDNKPAKKQNPKTNTTPVLDKKSMRTFQLNVVGPDGKPVPHALVEIRMSPAPTAKQILRGEYVRKSYAKTDDVGRLKLEIPQRTIGFSMSIKQPGYGPYWASWSSSEHPEKIPAEFTVKLDKAWTVGGVIVDESGQPVEGVRVSPSVKFKRRPGDNREMGVGTRITTDKNGQWRFDNVPDSKNEVFISVNQPEHLPLRRRLSRSEFEIKGSEKPSTPLVLQAGLTISGTVTDETGKPIPGVIVRTKFGNDVRKAKTDQQGKYQIVGCEPKITQVLVFAKGRATDMQKVRVMRDMAPVNFSMKPGGKIRVRMVDEQGKGIPKWRILIQRWRGTWNTHMELEPMNEYADENGVWEWNEAPLDEFKADINRPRGMQLSNQPLIAREAEYVFSPPKALVISGRVIDATTKQPIKKFRVTPGLRFKTSKNSLFWNPSDSFESYDGQYHIRINRDDPAHFIRIETDNYEVTSSRAIKPTEGNVTIDFALEPAKDITANILTASGEPAAGAEIAVGVAGAQISIKQGKLRKISTYARRLKSDDKGRFRIPPRIDPFQLVILHSAGFAHLKSTAGPIPGEIKLTPWARLEGTFRLGKKIAPHVSLALNNGISNYGDNEPSISTQNDVKTDASGRFVFDRVFPGNGRVGREIVWMVHEGSTEAISSRSVLVEFFAGKTTTLNLGGDGTRIVGKLVPPANYTGKVLWNFGSLRLDGEFKFPDMPTQPLLTNEAKKLNKQYLAWFKEWVKTKEGKVWQAAYDKYLQWKSDTPRFTISIAGDGSFQIDDVPAGKYTLKFWPQESISAILKEVSISVPAIKAGQAAEPIDLGNLTLEN
ncbi:MAG: carboxypeptidase regulatory-like domain-containing protein [Gimesia sp.]